MFLKNAILGTIIGALCIGQALDVRATLVKFENGDHGKLIVKAGDKELTAGEKNDLPEGTKISIEVVPDEGYTLNFVKVDGLSYIKQDKDGKPVLNSKGNEITVTNPSYYNCHLNNGKISSFQAMKEYFVLGNKAISITSEFEKYVELSVKVEGEEALDFAKLLLVTAAAKESDEKLLASADANGIFPYKIPNGVRFYYVFKLKSGYKITKFLATETKLDGKTKTENYLKYITSNSSRDEEGNVYAPAYNYEESEKVQKLEFQFVFAKNDKEKPGAVYNTTLGQLDIYPNPFAENLYVKGLNGVCRLSLVDAIGMVHLRYQTQGAKEVNLNTSALTAGVYLLVVENENARYVYKVIK